MCHFTHFSRKMSIAIISLCSFLCGVYAQVAPDLNIGTMPAMFAHGDHFSVGQQVGYFTRNSIKFRLNNSEAIQNVIEWVESTREGFSAYQAMLMTAKETFPEYIDELRGMAYGSGISFQTLFILNVRSELGVFMLNESNFEKVEHCSDYLLHTDTGIVIGHNEDGGWEDRDNSVLLTIHIEGQRVKEQIKFTGNEYASV